MKDNDLQRAKEIFLQYSCNHFFLDREVDAKEYKNFDVSNEQEYKWTREYVSHWMSRLSVDDLLAVDRLSATYAGESLPEMFEILELGDSFAKLWYANAIWHIAWGGGSMSPIMRERARQKSIFLWQSLLNDPIIFTDDHRKRVYEIIEKQAPFKRALQEARERRGLAQNTDSFQVTTPDEYILNYAKSKLRESKQRGRFSFFVISFVFGLVSVGTIIFDLIDKIKRLGRSVR